MQAATMVNYRKLEDAIAHYFDMLGFNIEHWTGDKYISMVPFECGIQPGKECELDGRTGKCELCENKLSFFIANEPVRVSISDLAKRIAEGAL